MENVMVVGTNNEKANIIVVRYFDYNNQRYLIYTLNEKDESGYIKLYISKITEQNGTVFANGIVNEDEWAEIRNLIKVIIKEIREGNLVTVTDCNIEQLINAVIVDFRAFKLIANIVEVLGSNKKVFEKTETSMPVEEEVPNVFNSEPTIEVQPEIEKSETAESNYTDSEEENSFSTFESLVSNNDNITTEQNETEEKYETEVNNEMNYNVENDGSVSYKELYEKLLVEKKSIEDELYDLRSRFNVIKNIIG